MKEAKKTVLFYGKSAPKALLRQYASAEQICTEQLERWMLVGRTNRTILLALSNARIGDAAALCGEMGCETVLVLPTDNGAASAPIRADVTKPRLDYMETEITRRCNLHCRGCCDYIQLASDEPPLYDPDAFELDLTQLKQFYWGVAKIRLLGGEPLLSKEIAAYAETTRRIFPDCDLRIVTNGLLIPSLPPETLERLKTCRCSFDISNYPPTVRQRKAIVSRLKQAGVSYDMGVPVRFFFRTLSEKPAKDTKPAFENCLFTHCHMLAEGGLLAPCSFSYCIRRLNRRFGTQYPEDDVVDLYQTKMDARELNAYLSSPHAFCAYCARGMAPMRWKDGVRADKADLRDWIVSEDFWTSRVLPFVQHGLKPAANALRRFVQRKKV